jgi:hypothetical protein
MQRYVRFRSDLVGDYTKRLGVFHAWDRLVDGDGIDTWSAERGEEIYEWFNKHLPARGWRTAIAARSFGFVRTATA